MPSHLGALDKNKSDKSTSSYKSYKSDPATSHARKKFTSISSDHDIFKHNLPDPTRGGSFEPLDNVSERSGMEVTAIEMTDLERGELEHDHHERGDENLNEQQANKITTKPKGLRPREMSMGARSKYSLS